MAADRSAAGTNRAAITVCVILATIMQALDTTIANIALPYIQGSVSASQDQINWVLTSYIVAAAIMTPPTGFLAGRFGRKSLYLVAVAGFTVASMRKSILMMHWSCSTPSKVRVQAEFE
jgi:MFS transporter, DHA2 family, multidrug resistance protein